MFKNIIDHIRNHSYMGGIKRDQTRITQTEEIFTPTELVQKSLDLLELQNPNIFKDVNKTFIDNSCGDGQFLGEIVIRKIENGLTFEEALSTTYGVDLMQDNVDMCRERLLAGQEHLRPIVERNIICADALRYHYRFDNSYPYDDEIKEQKQNDLMNNLFDFD